MNNQFYGKEYGDYFAQLEKDIEIKQRANEAKEEEVPQKAKANKRSKQILKAKLMRFCVAALSIALVVGVIMLAVNIFSSDEKKVAPKESVKAEKEDRSLYPKVTLKTDSFNSVVNLYENKPEEKGIKIEAGIFVDLKENTALGAKSASRRLYPASLTKIMTLLVAVENITDYSQSFKMTYHIINPIYGEASMAGYSSGEILTVDDLLYGCILPSGGEAAVGLGVMVSGSEEEFVKLMNRKAKEMGLKNTNFTNCTGLYNKDHYSSAEDMAVILAQALKNDKCREVLSAQKYVSSITPQHPKGLTLQSNLFSNLKGDEPQKGVILGGKTGYVGQSGYCLATFGADENGREYVCVTLNAPSKWPAVYDHINSFSAFLK